METSGHGPMDVLFGNRLKFLRKYMKTPSQQSRCSGRDSSSVLPKHKSTATSASSVVRYVATNISGGRRHEDPPKY
jgi:hypothetical protein